MRKRRGNYQGNGCRQALFRKIPSPMGSHYTKESYIGFEISPKQHRYPFLPLRGGHRMADMAVVPSEKKTPGLKRPGDNNQELGSTSHFGGRDFEDISKITDSQAFSQRSSEHRDASRGESGKRVPVCAPHSRGMETKRAAVTLLRPSGLNTKADISPLRASQPTARSATPRQTAD